jgi:replicative DNA helicase
MNALHPNAPIEIRMPPHSMEAEQSLLGVLLISAEAFDRCAGIVSEGDFYRDDHRRIWRHIARHVEQGKPVDVVIIADSIERSNETDQTGGLVYLAELAAAVPGTSNVERYAEIVADRAQRRALLAAALETQADAERAGQESARDRIDTALGRLLVLSDARPTQTEPEHIQIAIGAVIGELEVLVEQGGALPGLSTGFVDLDKRTTGLHPGEFIVIAGRPAMGKTALALNIAEHAALNGKTVAVFSMEMTKAELAKRSLASVGRVSLNALRTGQLTDDDWERMTAAMGRLYESKLIVDETGGLTLGQLRSRARRIKRREGGLDLIVIDYIQLMEASRDGENRNAEITAISRGIKAMAKELRCPVIGLSQLSRKVEERTSKRPIMSDLRESGAIEQDADLILMMYRDEYYKPDTPEKGIAEVIIGKQRNGPTGEVRLAFEGEYARFGNLAFADVSRMAMREPGRKRGKGFSEGD